MPQTPGTKAIRAAEKFRTIIDQWQWQIGEKRVSVTVSIGLAGLETIDSPDLHEFVKRTDDALYVAKKQGRNSTVRWEEINTCREVKKLQTSEYCELQTKLSSLAESSRAQILEVVSAFMKTLAVKDPYTAYHAQKVQVYVAAIAEEMAVSVARANMLNTSVSWKNKIYLELQNPSHLKSQTGKRPKALRLFQDL